MRLCVIVRTKMHTIHKAIYIYLYWNRGTDTVFFAETRSLRVASCYRKNKPHTHLITHIMFIVSFIALKTIIQEVLYISEGSG